MSLFGGLTSQARSRNLVEFKAGKMTLRGNMVYPDKRKGLVYLHQGNDMLMHFCWKERTNNRVEDDLVIFPEEIEFKKVTQNTTGRVYILKWRSTTKKFFFWMQEPKEDKDEEFCRKINNFLNNPPAPGLGGSSDDGNGPHSLQPLMEQIGGPGGIDPNLLSNVLNGMNPSDLIPLLSSMRGGGSAGGALQNMRRTAGGSPSISQRPAQAGSNTSAQRSADSRPNTAPAATRSTDSTTNRTANTPSSSSSTATAPIQMNALTSVLANLGTNNTTQTAGNTTNSIDLCEIMKSENLIPLLSNKNVQEKISSHLPQGVTIPETEDELKQLIPSAQFRQIVQGFTTVFQSGELNPLLTQFNYPTNVINAANQRDLRAFASALDQFYQTSNDTDTTMDTN